MAMSWLDQLVPQFGPTQPKPIDQGQLNQAIADQNTIPPYLRAPAESQTIQTVDASPIAALIEQPKPKALDKMSEKFRSYMPKPEASMSPELNQLKTLSDNSLKDQQDQLSGLNQYINEMAAKPRGINFTPLAALVDNLYGSKLAPTVAQFAPQSEEDKDKMLFGLRQQLAGGQAKLSADQLKALQDRQAYERDVRKQTETERHNLASESAIANKMDSFGQRALIARNAQAINAGKDFEKDKIISTSKVSLNSLARSSSILDNTSKPVTSKDLNLAYTDYINAVAAGGAATEGKIARELPETYEQRLNEFKQKFGENADLRNTPGGAELVRLLKENIRTVKSDLNSAVHEQTKFIEDNYGAVDNPLVHETIARKMKRYDESFGAASPVAAPEHDEALGWAKANPQDPRAAEIMKLHGG